LAIKSVRAAVDDGDGEQALTLAGPAVSAAPIAVTCSTYAPARFSRACSSRLKCSR
jgi:hypothetical protein